MTTLSMETSRRNLEIAQIYNFCKLKMLFYRSLMVKFSYSVSLTYLNAMYPEWCNRTMYLNFYVGYSCWFSVYVYVLTLFGLMKCLKIFNYLITFILMIYEKPLILLACSLNMVKRSYKLRIRVVFMLNTYWDSDLLFGFIVGCMSIISRLSTIYYITAKYCRKVSKNIFPVPWICTLCLPEIISLI